MFSMLEVMPVLLGWRFHSSIRCFDATRLPLSNKLEFAQFGAHIKKFWQFCFSPCGSTAVAAVVPLVASSGSTAAAAVVPLVASSGSTAPVPLYYRLVFGSALFVSGSAVVARQ